MQPSPYALIGEELVDAGYAAIPVRPGTKLPGSMSFGEWYGEMAWQRFCSRLPTPFETQIWKTWTDAGVCTALGFDGLIAIDIDTEDADITAAILSVLPDSPVAKKGAKGKTLFYRGNVLKTDPETGEITGHIPSRGFNVGNERAMDLLAFGKQTILPPSLHPSGVAYQWITEDTLVDTPIEKLPTLPDNIADLLAEVLKPFGYTEPVVHSMNLVSDSDNYWRGLKDLAFANLDRWVPDLGLPKTKKHNAGNWRAVAAWRADINSNAVGNALSFTPKGIKDFGDNDAKHSPIDVVMLAHNTDLETATRWLSDQLGYKPPSSDSFDYKKLIENVQARKLNESYVAPGPVHSSESISIADMKPVAAPRGTIDPFDPANVGGVMGAIAQFTLDTAYRPSREFATLAAIGFMSALSNRRYVSPSGFGTNVYMIGLAPPSFGKEHPQNVIKTLAFDTNKPFLLGAGEVSSGSAIEKMVRRAPNSLMLWDEMGIILQSINGRNAASHSDSIRKVLLDVFSKSRHGSIWYGKETANQDKDNAPIHSPTISLLGFSTTTEFYKGLPESSLRDGFLARVMIIQAEERGERQKTRPLLVPPPSLLGVINESADTYPKKGNLANATFRSAIAKPTLYPCEWADSAAERKWMDVDDWQIEAIDGDGGQWGIVGRASENTQKLATLRAISRNAADPRLTVEDINWGYSIVQRSLDNVDTGVRDYMADSDHERLGKAIVEALKGTKKGLLHESSLVRRKGIAKYDERARNSAIKDLIITGVIKAVGKAFQLVEAAEENSKSIDKSTKLAA